MISTHYIPPQPAPPAVRAKWKGKRIAGVTVLSLWILGAIGLAAFALVGASDAVTQAAWAYYDVRIWSAPFAFANFSILGSVIGRGRTDLGLLLQVTINLLNIVLTLIFVGLGLGVTGDFHRSLAPPRRRCGRDAGSPSSRSHRGLPLSSFFPTRARFDRIGRRTHELFFASPPTRVLLTDGARLHE